MTKRNGKTFLGLILCILCISGMLLSACNFDWSGLFDGGKDDGVAVSAISTPSLGIDNNTYELSWYSVENASSYKLYCNNTLISTIVANSSINIYTYDFESIVQDEGVYSFKIQALTNNESYINSEYKTVIYINKGEAVNELNYIYDNDNFDVENVAVGSDGVVSWDENSQVDNYIVCVYSNSLGIKYYNSSSLSFNLKSIYSSNDILAINVGGFVASANTNLYLDSQSNTLYNPLNYGAYTSNIYYFDGSYNDHYIESVEELYNVVYYHFIYRDTLFNLKFSSNAVSEINNLYSSSVITTSQPNESSRICGAISYSYDTFLETNDFSQTSSTVSSSDRTYSVTNNFSGVVECLTEISPKPSSSYYPTGYYNVVESSLLETYSNTYKNLNISTAVARSASFDNFISDSYLINTQVSTSEQLYWAVENNITPICVAGSRAETIYNLTKKVLREIIYDSMTDYEKAKAIFDWVENSTTYSYLNAETYYSYTGTKYTQLPYYYLEGVFITGEAVCDGFSKAYSLLCNMEGVECIRITGLAYTGVDWGGHAWNKIKINNNYYLVDVTWTPIGYITRKNNAYIYNECLSRKYFLVSDAFVVADHEAYETRTKFANYATPSTNYEYTFTAISYSNVDNTLITEDLVVKSNDELKNIMQYAMDKNLNSIEIVYDETYINTLLTTYASSLSTISDDLEKVETAINIELKKQKFQATLLSIIMGNGVNFLYDNEHYGFIAQYSFSLLVDKTDKNNAENETDLPKIANHLSEYAKIDSSVYLKKFKLYIDSSYFNNKYALSANASASTIQNKINTFIVDMGVSGKVKITYIDEADESFNLNGSTTQCYTCELEVLIPA